MGTPDVIWEQRKGAMITHDAWAVVFQIIDAGLPGLVSEQFTLGVYDAAGTKTGNISRNYHYLVSSKSPHKDLSWTFLKWMNEGPDFRMQDFMTNVFGFVASVKNYPLPKPYPDQMKGAFAASLKESNQTSMPVIKGLAEVYTIMQDNFDALVLGKVNADDYTKKLDDELKQAMQKAYSE